jgi:hypothetical protein
MLWKILKPLLSGAGLGLVLITLLLLIVRYFFKG